jgi:ribosomal protein S20
MPITQSAKQALRKDRRRTVVNLRRKRAAKKALDAIKKTPSKDNFKQAVSQLDKLIKHHLIHKNKAAHLKSQLSQLLSSTT